jgi:hypothetical protein
VASSVAALGLVAAPAFARGVRILSTGVGIESRIPHRDFPLLVVFAESNGPLLADVKVDVKDQAGATVVKTVSNGPWLYLGLPSGTYNVIATPHNGRTETDSVNIPAAVKGSSTVQKVLRMTWPGSGRVTAAGHDMGSP